MAAKKKTTRREKIRKAVASVEFTVEAMGVDPRVIAELHRIYQRDGELEIGRLVPESRKKTSPLYIAPGVAEAAGREHLLRKLVGRVYYQIVSEEWEAPVKFRRYVSVEKGDSRAYMASEDVARDRTLAEAYRQRLIEQLKRLQDGLQRFEEFVPLAKMIEEVLLKESA